MLRTAYFCCVNRLRYILILTLFALGFSSCKKEPVVLPKAAFSVGWQQTDTYVIIPYRTYSLQNYSEQADSYAWDFGNGIVSKEKEPDLMYTQRGEYSLRLTAIKNGKTSVAYKKVQVVAPSIKRVTITSLNWNNPWGKPISWPHFTKADVWVEIRRGESGQTYPALSNGIPDAPLVYKTPVTVNTDSTAIPIVFNLPQPIDVDLPALYRDWGYKGTGYIISFHARDQSGTYLLGSTSWSGVGIIYDWDIITKHFTIRTAGPTQAYSVEISGNFE